jgi:tetratricopeptide (TPR) repeat protein
MTSSRTVRVFLSSTFRDFAEERDLLVKKVFPELRRRCRERQVELVDVDLRWGITEEQAQKGEVLPICLAEIDRSRPYFMGFIGDRYGWVPEHHQYDLSLLVEQPWLDEHRGGKSVTELEMLHGVLNNPQMAGRAFFYFRNSEYSQSKGGPYLSEGSESALKLEALKDRIRTGGFPVVENYADPEALAERVKADLWRVIDEAYPVEDVPDPLILERRKHEAYGGSRLGLYLGGKQNFQALDAAMMAETFKPVLITGASGGGKSALIANWSRAYSEVHPDTLEIVHYLGSGADAGDPVKLVTRLLQEISRITGDELKLESDPQKILDALPEWLARASSYAEREGRQWLILLDGLDKLSSLRDLRWWPGFLPPRVKLVVSCLDGEVQDEARKRMVWAEIKVHPFTPEEQREFITEHLGKYRKSLKPEQVARVQEHPLSGNPLFLRTLLEELRIFGVHEELEKKITWYLESHTADQLFTKVLERVEGDTDANAVRSAMEAIWASRAGLSQDELLAITGLVPATWAPIHNALDEAIFESGGRIQFGHDFLRTAVEELYLDTKTKKKAAHIRIAAHFDDIACEEGVDSRLVEELPWQLRKAGRKKELIDALTDKAIFEGLYDRDTYELTNYWLVLRQDPVSHYENAWREWKSDAEDDIDLSRAGFRLAEFLRMMGSTSSLLEEMYGQAVVALGEDGEYKDEGRISVENSRGLFLLNQGNFVEAEAIFRKGLLELEAAVGRHHPDALDAINNLAQSLWRQGKNAEANPLYGEVLEARVKLFGENHPRTISSLIGSGNVASALGKHEEARRLMERVLCASQRVYGEVAEQTCGCSMNLANLLRDMGSHQEAEPRYVAAESGFRELFGSDHPLTLSCRSNHAILLCRSGNPKRAKKTFQDVLSRRIEIFGKRHPDVFASLNNLATACELSGDFKSAENYYRESLAGRLRLLGPVHHDSVQCVNNLGNLLEKIGNPVGAEKVFTDYLRKIDRVMPLDAPLSLQLVNYLAILTNKHGKRKQALALLRKRSEFSPKALDALCYNIACYECLEGNTKEAFKLIRQHLKKHPDQKDQALSDQDLSAIKEVISNL